MNLRKENLKTILGVITFTLILFFVLMNFTSVMGILRHIVSIISPFILGFCFAYVINVLLRPIEKLWDKLFAKKKAKIFNNIKRPVSLVVSILLLIGAIFVLLFIIVPEITKTIETLIVTLPGYMEEIEIWCLNMENVLTDRGIVIPEVDIDFEKVGETITDFLSTSGKAFFNKTLDFTTSIFSAVFNIVLAFVFSLYLLAQKELLGKQFKRFLNAYLPKKRVEWLGYLSNIMNRAFTKFITGQLTEAVIIGVLCFIGMSIFSIPYAMMVSVLVGFTALIPVFGAFIGTGIGAFLILMVNPIKALWFIIFIIILQQLEGNLIYPKVVGKSVGLPGIWVFAAVTIGGGIFGMVGMLISVPVCSVIYTLLRESVNKRTAIKKQSAK